MSASFEEIERRSTAMGEISLRRRWEPTLLVDVYEVKLQEEFLMSSLFTAAEVALAEVGLAAVAGSDLDVVVGGLGLGYTARAVLGQERVASLRVVETVGEVIDWHERGLLPLAAEITSDPRCRLVHGDFFAMVAAEDPFGPAAPDRCHAILVDIDHTPHHLLHPSHAAFYEVTGLQRLAARLHPGGVFALWSDDPPDEGYIAVVEEAIGPCTAHDIRFPNPFTGGEAGNTVYVATRPPL